MVRNVHFSENLAWFVVLLPLFCDSPFCLITDENFQTNFCSKSNVSKTVAGRSAMKKAVLKIPRKFHSKLIPHANSKFILVNFADLFRTAIYRHKN